MQAEADDNDEDMARFAAHMHNVDLAFDEIVARCDSGRSFRG